MATKYKTGTNLAQCFSLDEVCESLKVCGRLYGENLNCDGRAGARNVHGVDDVNYDEVLVVGWW